jgi:2-polyprenyl-6-methoxyphenol hydroxylase-like FAD-dependent oxidoreductase
MMYNVHACRGRASNSGAERTRVLIVGGGLVGLCASLFLSYQGVGSILAERRVATSPQPKARRISIRTMELFRQLGIDGPVAKAAAALADFQGMSAGQTLAQAEPLPFRPPGGNPDWADCSPVTACLCAQDLLEPVLRELAADRGGDIRFGTEVLDTSQDADGVTAAIRGPGGELARIRADYLIAADGPLSPVRDRLGIARSGRGTLRRVASIYLRADLTDLVRGREFNLCQIENPDAPGTFASINGTDRWIFTTAPCPSRDADEWRAITKAAIGSPGIPVSVESVQEWELGQLVADRLSLGRIFLTGDAAHVMPPFAALGANTGIQDAHNLAWKLALVIDGTAAPGLLDSYHAERHPAAWFAARQSLARTPNLREMQTISADGTPLADPLALTLGFQYPGGAVIGDGSTAAIDHLDLRGQPGTRLPHRWLPGGHRSTLDLAGRRLTLITGRDGAAWADATASSSGPGIQVEQVGLPGWGSTVGTGEGGALLVRPDQVVAWRHPGPAADPRAALAAALARLLGPGPAAS